MSSTGKLKHVTWQRRTNDAVRPPFWPPGFAVLFAARASFPLKYQVFEVFKPWFL